MLMKFCNQIENISFCFYYEFKLNRSNEDGVLYFGILVDEVIILCAHKVETTKQILFTFLHMIESISPSYYTQSQFN